MAHARVARRVSWRVEVLLADSRAMHPLKRLAIDVAGAMLLAVLDTEGADVLVVPIAASGSAAPIPKQDKAWYEVGRQDHLCILSVVACALGDLAANQPRVYERVVVGVGSM